MNLQTTLENLEAVKCRSAWSKGVKEYAYMLLDNSFSDDDDYKEITNRQLLHEALLGSASDWKQFSYNGDALICDSHIAKTLCNPSELKRCKGGSLPPNKQEQWVDVQTRALFQAERLIQSCVEFN